MMSTMATNLDKIAQVLEQSSDPEDSVELYDKGTYTEGFDDEFLVEALNYIYSDGKKARTFLLPNER